MRLVALILLLLPMSAHAEEVVSIIGYALTIVGGVYSWIGYALIVGASVYGAEQAKKAAAAQREKNRIAYNAGLQDRTATSIATDAPYRTIYGRALVGSDIVAIFTTGNKDQYKYLVCIHAAHECDAIEEIFINGVALGVLDGSGNVTKGKYFLTETVSVGRGLVSGESYTGTVFTLLHTPITGTLWVMYSNTSSGWYYQEPIISLVGTTVTVATSRTYKVYYDYNVFTPRVRVTKHLGSSTDTADTGLIADVPTKWFSTSVLRGFCYTVVRIDLTYREFQSGVPSVTALIRGKKLLDQRSSTTAWSQNPALVLYDYLRSDACNVPSADIPTAEYNTAATVSDQITGCTFSQSGTAVTVTKTAHGLALNDVREMLIATPASATILFSIANPCVVTWTAHGKVAGNPVVFVTTGRLPLPLLPGVVYYVLSSGLTANAFQVGATAGGTAISTSFVNVDEAQSGDHTATSTPSGHRKLTAITANTFTYTSPASITATGTLAVGGLYTVNGTVVSADDPKKNLEQIAQSMAGNVIATTWGVNAGKYTAAVMALDQSDVVGSLSVLGGASDADLYNGVRGQFIGQESQYVPTDFKPYQNATYKTADGERDLWSDISLPFTDDTQRIHNLARINTEDQRNGFTLKGIFSYKTWALKVGQRVTFTSALFGQTAKIYRLTDKKFGVNQAIELSLKEDAASIWDLSDAVVVDATPNTTLPNPFFVGLCGNLLATESLYQTTGSVGVRSKATLTWDAPADSSILDYIIEYWTYTDTTWRTVPNILATSFEILDLSSGKYDVRVQARNNIGATGQFTALTTFNIYGLTAAPANITNFSVRVVSGQALVTMDKSLDLDVLIGGRVILRWSPNTVGVAWNDGILLSNEFFPGDGSSFYAPLLQGTYLAKFMDSTGNVSASSVSFLVTEAAMTGFTTLAALTEHPSFTGAKVNTAFVGSGIQLVGAMLWDSMGAIDSQDSIDSLGGIVTTGSYDFASRIDLGSVITVKMTPRIDSYGFDVGDLWDSRLSLMDTWGLVDGSVIEDAEVKMEIRTTNDNPAGSPTWGSWHALPGQADYNARAFEARVQFTSADVTHNRNVLQLSLSARQAL